MNKVNIFTNSNLLYLLDIQSNYLLYIWRWLWICHKFKI